MQIPGRNPNFRQRNSVQAASEGPVSGRSPETPLQDGILVMSDKLNKCRNAFKTRRSLYFVLFLEKKLKAGINLMNAYTT